MEVTILFIKFLFTAMFLSTGLPKLRKIEEQKIIVKQYQLLPESLITKFIIIDATLQGAVALLFALGIFQAFASGLTITLLLMYSLAIGINLIRGRREISCGCGGLIGNHQLSWWLVIRNLTLILLAMWLYTSHGILGSLQAHYDGYPFNSVFGYSYFFTLIFTVTAVVGFLSVTGLIGLRKRIEQLFMGV